MERTELSDRQFEAVLDRLDQLVGEVRALNRRLDRSEELQKIVRELAALSESLQTLAYAALGQSSPQVRRRRTG